MTSEPKRWVKVGRRGRMKGVEVQIHQGAWEQALTSAGIALDTPLDQLRVTRYMTKNNTIIIKVKHIRDIPEDEPEERV